MPDDQHLRPATRDELRDARGYGLRYGTHGKTHRHASDDMARIAASVLIDHLELCGFVVMKKPPAPPLSAPTGRLPIKP